MGSRGDQGEIFLVPKLQLGNPFLCQAPPGKDYEIENYRSAVILLLKRNEDETVQKRLDESDLDVLSYDRQWRQYRVRLKEKDLEGNNEILKWLMKEAYDSYMR